MINLNTSKTTWDLTPLFKSDNDPEMETYSQYVETQTNQFIQKWENRDDYLIDPEVMEEALSDYEQWQSHCGTYSKLDYYFGLRTSQDENSPILKAKKNLINEKALQLGNRMQFFTIRVAKIPFEYQQKFLDSQKLVKYKHFLEKLFTESQYILSEQEERIINLKSQSSYSNWVRMTAGFLSKEKRPILMPDGQHQEKSFSEVVSLSSDKHKPTRDSAAENLNDIFFKYIEVGENEINAILGNKKIDDQLRGAQRPDTFRHLADDLEAPIVDSLVDVVSSRFDLAQQYYSLKAKLFKVPFLQYHERNLEFGEINKKYSYQESVDLVHTVFSKLDSEFAEIFKKFVENGHVDAFPYQGKRGGAFCAHRQSTQPTYILLNHTDRLNDVLTIAHEAGHGINNELIKKTQNELNFGTPTSTAEVASTFMEDFVLQELLQDADENLKLALMVTKLNDDISSIFRQIAFYKFEWELHTEFRQQGYLSKDQIGNIFRKNMENYMGPAVEQSPGSENWWLYIPHFRYFFYVYSYSGGLLISKSLQNSVKKDHSFINKVKRFLSAGLSESPQKIFKEMEIDISDPSFWNSGLNEIENLLQETTLLARKMKYID